jgi:hypothetical protein
MSPSDSPDEYVTAAELMDRLQHDPQYVARMEQRERAQR